MDRITNAIKAIAMQQAASFGQPRFGIVSSYNPADGTARVLLQPEGILTGWLPVLSQAVGSGWGLHCPFNGGEQVLVLPQDGDAEHGVIVGRAWSDNSRPPPGGPGEMILTHASGSSVKLTGDGKVSVQDGSGTSLVFSNDGNVRLTGNLLVSGDITDQHRTGATASLAQFRTAYDTHHHTGVGTGGGITGLTDKPV